MKVRSGSDVPDLISVIITTYDREDALDAVLAALSRQSDRGFEVVIADDGSGPGPRPWWSAGGPGSAFRSAMSGS